MATQKAVEESLKEWLKATEMTEAVKHAKAAATEFDALDGDSPVNLLARSPDLMLLLSAFLAGKQTGVEEEKQRHEPVQQGLLDG